ncbi:MAG: zinc-dependent peptidase [Gammaproteobacteria bacterium]|nr:zinc-dependent peptidase [Gammaproteobacteria bacterium]MDE2345031.1 zinc-dependent peptidase [Gammaproteobacteria bacterium]
MFKSIGKWREHRALKRHPIQESAWGFALAHCAAASRLSPGAQARLRVLATLLLRDKSMEPVQGLKLDENMRTLLAAHACLPILNLGLKWYSGWHAFVIYPGLFVPDRQTVDATGVVHRHRTVIAGESWQRGPLILSWEDVLQAGTPPGHNVVIHECAHKLDMQNGEANGFPPLHREMDRAGWSKTFQAAYTLLYRLHETGEPLPINPYALQNPAEFFAVTSETFFQAPVILRDSLPDVYRQLCAFYRRDPLYQ